MSDPLSAVEIEDVLSSIRRLVSEDLRPVARSGPQAARAPTGSALILTPALRVVPDAEPRVEAKAERLPPADDAEGHASSPAEVARDPAVGDVAAVEREAGQAVGVGASDAGGELVTDDTLPAAETDPESLAGWAQVGSDEGMVLRDHGTPDGPAPHADAGWADDAAAEVIAGLEQPDRVARRFSPDEDAPEISFDEEVLRDLVRDLIREELQGHLGERITRNIRKLVRAEIAQALAVADLD